MSVKDFDVRLRPVEPAGLEPWIRLWNECRHWKIDRAGFLFEESLRPVGEPVLRLGVYTPDGLLAGLAEAALGEYAERWKDRAGGFVAAARAARGLARSTAGELGRPRVRESPGTARCDAEVGDTGVLRSHRRRGIGRVLKLMATRYAVQRGFRYVYTDNRSDNAGMLASNRELGFVPSNVLVIFEKTFEK